MEDFTESYMLNLLNNNPPGFLKALNRDIVKGDQATERTRQRLTVITDHPQRDPLLRNHRDEFGDNLIHNVAKFHKSTDVLKNLLKICPKLALVQRIDRFEGQTALHIVVTKGNLKAARVILKSLRTGQDLPGLLHTLAMGSLFENTVMMGELALSVAALTLKTSMVDMLIQHGAKISQQNSRGDTVFHSLIRFASIHPEKLDDIINMIKHINDSVPDNMVSLVWYNTENHDRLTALKLAAALGQVLIFSMILNLENVYCKLNHHDGLFDIHLFDITEIDTITQAEWERNKQRERDDANSDSNIQQVKKKPAAQSHRPALIHRSPAVLDIICQIPTATAFDLMNVDVVKNVINTKWQHYRGFYYLWFLCHFLFMILITIYAVYKTKVINNRIYFNETSALPGRYDTTGTNESFVVVASILCCIYAAPYLVLEVFRSFYFKQHWHIGIIHHNGLYRLMMVGMAITLLADTIWFWVEKDNNYFLVLALLIGWTLMNFFLRAVRIFSFFTVMLQKVLLGDMTRFSVIIVFQLNAFSIGMYITFLNTNPVPPGFENVGATMMTVFKLMLGLTELDVLYEARHPWMAIFLFTACVLVTYVLLMNSLIALMSQTCALVSENRRMQWELQRLSVIHLVETMLLPRWRHLHKPGLKARRYNLDNQATEWRCFDEITSVQTTYTDGAAILRRKSMIRTIGFDDGSISFMTPLVNRFGSGRHSAMRTLPIHQNHTSLREQMIEEENENEQDTSEDETKPPTGITPSAVMEVIPPIESPGGGDLACEGSASRRASDGKATEDDGQYGHNGERPASKNSSKSNKEPPKTDAHLRVMLSPRKRHNSERVNRKTQTVNTNHLSHSYPDGSLRTPLHRKESDVNPQIVYVVPTSVMNQQFPHLADVRPVDAHITDLLPQQINPQSCTPYPEDVYSRVGIPTLPKIKHTTDVTFRVKEKGSIKLKDVKDDVQEQVGVTLSMPTTNKVQSLDIDTLHSSI